MTDAARFVRPLTRLALLGTLSPPERGTSASPTGTGFVGDSAVMRRLLLIAVLAVPAFAQWENVGPGVDYRRFDRDGQARMHVSRVDLRDPLIRVVSSMQSERGLTTSEFARRNNAIIAVNGDYFDSHLKPVGLAIGACGPWTDTCDRGGG